jgi:hypothetical protein
LSNGDDVKERELSAECIASEKDLIEIYILILELLERAKMTKIK